MPEQEVFMNHAEGGKEAYGSQRALETGCNTGALKSVRTPRESPQKMSSLSVLLLQLAVKDISSRRNLNHCHRFICQF